MTPQDTHLIDQILTRYRAAPERLIALLQDIQTQYGYLPEEVLRYVAGQLKISTARIYAVASFYSGFSFTPHGRYRIEICHGTACHVRGSTTVTERIREVLHLEPGQTSSDGSFSIHTVRCLGCCALAPVVKVNNTVYANVSRQQVTSILEQYR